MVARRARPDMAPRIPAETRVTIGFMAVGLTLWYLSAQFTDSDVVSFATLIGVGVVVPLLVNELRERRT